MSDKTVLIYSGGLDSTTLLYHLLDEGHDVHCLSVNYGQRHSRELVSARRITEALDVPHVVLSMQPLRELLGGSALTDDVEVPHGHYAEESMRATVVPNRNMILLSMAIGWAINLGGHRVAYGAHQGDHAIYPDCRPEFFGAMIHAAALCDYEPVELIAPFMHMDKAEIVARGAELDVPFEETWTCYEGDAESDLHCGECGSCVERAEAFELAGVLDPTRYKRG